MNDNNPIKEKYKSLGYDVLNDTEKIRLLLSYSENPDDADRIARQLSEFYGSLRTLSDADFLMLRNEYHLTDSSLVLLGLVPAVSRMCALDKCRNIRLNSTFNAREYFSAFFHSAKTEMLVAVTVSRQFRIVSTAVIAYGDISNVEVSIRRALEFVGSSDEKCLFAAHCHPDGSLSPSENDISATMKFIETLKVMNIKLADHIIIAGGDSVSLRESTGDRVFSEPLSGYTVSTTDEL